MRMAVELQLAHTLLQLLLLPSLYTLAAVIERAAETAARSLEHWSNPKISKQNK